MKPYCELSPDERRAFDSARIKEMQRIKAATPGEVILLNKTHHNLLSNLMPDSFPPPNPKDVLFHGILGIYEGIDPRGSFITFGDERVILGLKSNHNYELSLIVQEGLPCPFLRPPFGVGMSLDEHAYIGPQEIYNVLKNQCDSHFQRFFVDYVKVNRKVKN
jgi:hypothetical protein